MAKYVDLNGVRTWYDIHGSGEPLVVLHPGGVGVDSRALGTPGLIRGVSANPSDSELAAYLEKALCFLAYRMAVNSLFSVSYQEAHQLLGELADQLEKLHLWSRSKHNVFDLMNQLLVHNFVELTTDEITFWHASFRDYFAALYICALESPLEEACLRAEQKEWALVTTFLGTDVSFIHQRHPLVEATVEYRDVQLASPTDIGLMKLAAVNARGTRRDFIDLYCLRDIAPLDQLLELAKDKYADRRSFLTVAARALAHFEDAEQQPMPRMLQPVRWSDVRAYCEDAARRLARRLSSLD